MSIAQQEIMRNYTFLYSRKMLSCSVVQTLRHDERCTYVLNSPECKTKQLYINYVQLLYCTFDPRNWFTLLLSIIALLLICGLVFWVLAITTDRFFCPALKMLSKNMGLSEHLAGVTLLAFGNGSPDLFTSIAGSTEDSRFLFSDLLGAALFVNVFNAGIITILNPFSVQWHEIWYDELFIVFAVLYINYCIANDGGVTILESCLVILIYVLYIIALCFEQWLIKRRVRLLEAEVRHNPDLFRKSLELERMRSIASIEIVAQASRISIDLNATRDAYLNLTLGPNANLYSQFVQDLNPIQMEHWHAADSNQRTQMLLTALSMIPLTILKLFIPISDYELPSHGWSKLLNVIQIVLLPASTFAFIYHQREMAGFPIYWFTFPITVPLAIFIFRHSRTDVPPPFHTIFSLYACAGSMFIIYTCASECVQILYVLGLVTNCSSAFVGVTLLAWGNSIGDLVSNIILATSGYTRMAFAACVGGPFFNCALGMGSILLYLALNTEEGKVYVNMGPLADNMFIFFIVFHLCTMLWVFTTNFRVRRSIGIFNILIYAVNILFVILIELEIIQSFEPETGSLRD